MGEYDAKEYCRKCGGEVFPFSKKYSVSQNDYFCVKCAERFDREYLIQHTCSMCKRLLGNQEQKMVMPSKIYGDEPLPYVHRVMCLACYQKLGYKDRDVSVMSNRLQTIRAKIRRGIAKRAVERGMKRSAVMNAA